MQPYPAACVNIQCNWESHIRGKLLNRGERAGMGGGPYPTQESWNCKLVKRIQKQSLRPLMRKAVKVKGNYFFENTSKESTPGDKKRKYKKQNKEK